MNAYLPNRFLRRRMVASDRVRPDIRTVTAGVRFLGAAALSMAPIPEAHSSGVRVRSAREGAAGGHFDPRDKLVQDHF